jgi:ribosome modulation factor
MSRQYGDEDVYDAADRAYEEHRQRMADAFADGRKVGRMGLGAGLCPQELSITERNEWLLGFHAGAAELLSERKAA